MAGAVACPDCLGDGAVQPAADSVDDNEDQRMIDQWAGLLPLAIVLSSLLPGLLIFVLREEQNGLRIFLNMLGVLLKLLLVGLMLWGVARGVAFRFEVAFLPGGGLILQGDAL